MQLKIQCMQTFKFLKIKYRYGLLAKSGDGDLIRAKTTFSHQYILHIESENVSLMCLVNCLGVILDCWCTGFGK